MPTITPYRKITSPNMNIEHKILLVDASGSMSCHTKETRESIYSIIKELDPDVHLTLIFFDTTEYKVVADTYVNSIPPELAYIYKAMGGTPITDSVYKAIQDISNSVQLEQLGEKHKVIIYTDGAENSSRHISSEELGQAIDHFTQNFGWDFQFIGPESERTEITRYTNSIKIKEENVTFYANISDGLKIMQNKTTS